jgi:hypothetical protein
MRRRSRPRHGHVPLDVDERRHRPSVAARSTEPNGSQPRDSDGPIRAAHAGSGGPVLTDRATGSNWNGPFGTGAAPPNPAIIEPDPERSRLPNHLRSHQRMACQRSHQGRWQPITPGRLRALPVDRVPRRGARVDVDVRSARPIRGHRRRWRTVSAASRPPGEPRTRGPG